MMVSRLVLVIILAFFVALPLVPGCTVGPDYVPPEIEMPDQWHQDLTQGLTEGEANLHTWWTVFKDPVLEGLIQRASKGNLDLRVTLARIGEARHQVGIATGGYYPGFGGSGSIGRQHLSNGALLFAEPGAIDRNLTQYQIGADVFWEFDVWGRIARTVESADAGFQAQVEDYRDVLVLLYSEVAIGYLQVRALQSRIAYALANVKAQKGSLKLTTDRFDADLAPELDIRQAELNLASTESTIPALRESLAQTVNRIAVLLGEHPGPLQDELSKPAPIPMPPVEVILGLPSNLLRQRPDLRAAERNLAAQHAMIGATEGELYPKFSLSGTLDLISLSSADFLSGDNLAWSIIPGFTWNIWDGGRIREAVKVEEARTEQLLIVYEQTVLIAIQEVEDALVGYAQERVRRDALKRAVSAAQRSVELVEVLYRTGVTNFQNVLDMQRSLAVQQDALAESEGRVVQNLVRLYKALGGGWMPEEPAGVEEQGGETPENTAN